MKFNDKFLDEFLKVFKISTIIVIIFLSAKMINAKQKSPVYARFKNVRCTSSRKTFISNYTCSIKAYNRFVAKLSVLVNFEVPTYQAFVNIDDDFYYFEIFNS
jgi:hypothetical protein